MGTPYTLSVVVSDTLPPTIPDPIGTPYVERWNSNSFSFVLGGSVISNLLVSGTFDTQNQPAFDIIQITQNIVSAGITGPLSAELASLGATHGESSTVLEYTDTSILTAGLLPTAVPTSSPLLFAFTTVSFQDNNNLSKFFSTGITSATVSSDAVPEPGSGVIFAGLFLAAIGYKARRWLAIG